MNITAVFVTVESQSRPGTYYTVRFLYNDKIGKYEWRCDCPQGTFKDVCKHTIKVSDTISVKTTNNP